MDHRIKRIYEIVLQEEMLDMRCVNRKSYVEFFLEWRDRDKIYVDDGNFYVQREITAIEKLNGRRS